MPSFEINDRRHSARPQPPSGWKAPADPNLRSMREKGFVLPTSGTMARIEAKKMVTDVRSRGTATDVANRAMMASMRGAHGGMTREAANTQMVLPKVRQPLASLMDKGIPFNVQDPDELIELRRWCSTPRSPVWMADYSFKPIGEIEVGEQVIGWVTEEYERACGRKRKDGKPSMGKRRTLTKSTVLAVNRRTAPEVVRIHFESGRFVECTPDHEWLRYYTPNPDGVITNGPEASWRKESRPGQPYTHGRTPIAYSDYAPLQVGSIARHVIDPTPELDSREKIETASWLAGIIDGEGSFNRGAVRICQSPKRNPHIVERIDRSLKLLGILHTRYVRTREDKRTGSGHHGGEMVIWDICHPRGHRNPSGEIKVGSRQQLVNLHNWTHPCKFDAEVMDKKLLSSNFGEPDEVVSIESLGPGEVVSMQTTTGNYTAWGYASKNCRLFYATHPLVPLLIDIYSKFPVMGMEFVCKDPEVEEFCNELFFNELNYEEFLPDGLLREYFMVGEVTALAHFNESLGTWSSEEILNPDMVSVTKSLFVEQERVQLLFKELVESLRNGPGGMAPSDERPSERFERTWEYQQLVEHYPEIIKAASQDDGLDVSDALVSRLVNKAAWWDLRGTPHLLRSFRTLMLEESLNAAQDAVCDRLYAPMILATLGIENMGDNEPWIPDQAELEDLRDDIQSALAADFKLLCHNMGLQVTSVFGRESVPRFDTDYDRIDAQLMQAWGIGQGLIMGGTGSGGTYAGTAINREVCEQLMKSAQNKVIRHMKKRMEVVFEAQEFYDFELKGGQRCPIYESIVEEDPDTGDQRVVEVPKLIDCDIKFATLNLRDESTERAFVAQLKQLGVPISDKTLAINIPFEFREELERQAQETVDKGMAQAEAYFVLQELCDEQGYPYPEDLATHLEATLELRAMLAQTEGAETQNKMMDQQLAQASPAGMMGLLPGTTMQPLAGADPEAAGDAATGDAAPAGPANPSDATPGQGSPMAAPTAGGSVMSGGDMAGTPYGGLTARRQATQHGPSTKGPEAWPPGGEVDKPMDTTIKPEVNTLRQRPEESDEQRGSMPKSVVGRRKRFNVALPGRGEEPELPDAHIKRVAVQLKRFGDGPSTFRRSYLADPGKVKRAIDKRAAGRDPSVYDLVHDPNFYATTHMQAYESQITADWPEIVNGGAPESRKLFDEMLEIYENATGIKPRGYF